MDLQSTVNKVKTIDPSFQSLIWGYLRSEMLIDTDELHHTSDLIIYVILDYYYNISDRDLTDEEKSIIQRAADLCTVNPLPLTSEHEQIMKEFFELSTSADDDKKKLIEQYSAECAVFAKLNLGMQLYRARIQQAALSTQSGGTAEREDGDFYNGGPEGGIFCTLCQISCCALIIMGIVTAVTDVEDEENSHFASFNIAWGVVSAICGVSGICVFVMHACSLGRYNVYTDRDDDYQGGNVGKCCGCVGGCSCCFLIVEAIGAATSGWAESPGFGTECAVFASICVLSIICVQVMHEIGNGWCERDWCELNSEDEDY